MERLGENIRLAMEGQDIRGVKRMLSLSNKLIERDEQSFRASSVSKMAYYR